MDESGEIKYLSPGEQAAESFTSFSRHSRNSGSDQLFSCIDMAARMKDKLTLKKEEVSDILRQCRNDVNSSDFTKFSYGPSYSPEFVAEVKEALALKIAQVDEEEHRVARAKRELEEAEMSFKKVMEEAESFKKSAKAAGLKEVL